MKEYFDVFDADRNPLGRTHERGVELPEGERGVGTEVWIVNSRSELLVTLRHPDKKHGGEWEAPGGLVRAGETSLEGAVREIREEIGVDISGDDITLLGTEKRKYQFVDAYLVKRDMLLSELSLQSDEVSDAKWVTQFEFERMCIKGEVTHSVIDRYSRFGDSIWE